VFRRKLFHPAIIPSQKEGFKVDEKQGAEKRFSPREARRTLFGAFLFFGWLLYPVVKRLDVGLDYPESERTYGWIILVALLAALYGAIGAIVGFGEKSNIKG
jgi:hypothetical protein